MLTYSIEIRGDRQVLEALGRHPHLLRLGIARAAFMVEARAKEKLSGQVLRVRTNRLRGSVTTKIEGAYPVFTAIVGPNVIYARIHEYGGVIVPRRAKFLRFVVDGKTVYAKRVVIPKRPYMQPSLQETRHSIPAVIGRTIAEGLNRAEGLNIAFA